MKTGMNRVFGNIAVFILGHRMVVTLIFLSLAAFLFSGVRHLSVDFSARAFFGGQDDVAAELDAFQEAWGADDRVILAVISLKDDVSGNLLTAPRIGAMKAFADALLELDGIKNVTSATHLPFPTMRDGMLTFAPVLDNPPKEEQTAKAWRANRLSDRDVVPTFLSADGRHAAIGIEVSIDTDNIGQLRPIVATIESVIHAHISSEQHIALGGMPVVRTGLLRLILADQMVFIPLSFVIMAMLLFILYRRFHGVFFPLLGAVIPVALVMGIMGYMGTPIGVVNQVYFTLLPVIAVAGGVHFLSRYYEEAHAFYRADHKLTPGERKTALINAYTGVAGACFFSGTTTVIGLFSLQLSQMPVLKNFGLYSAIGVALALCCLLLLLPVLMSATRGRVLTHSFKRRHREYTQKAVQGLTISLRYPRACLMCTGLTLGVAVWGSTLVVVDNSLSGMLGPSHPTHEAHHVIDTQLSGSVTLELDVQAEPGFFKTVKGLAVLSDLQTRAAQEPAVRASQSIADLVIRLNGLLSGAARLPTSDTDVAQILFLAEGRPELDYLVNSTFSRARVSFRSQDVGCNDFVALAQRLEHQLNGILAEDPAQAPNIKAVFTGTTLASYRGVNQLSHDMRRSILGAFIVILLIFIIIFRSLPLALIATIPNGFPLICGYGFLGFMGWHLEPGPAVVFTVALGIAVDDTIHLILRFKEEQEKRKSIEKSLQRAIWRSGRAVFITTVILAGGFAINGLSVFPNNQRVGILGALVVCFALLADLFVLPPLLLLWKRRGKGKHT